MATLFRWHHMSTRVLVCNVNRKYGQTNDEVQYTVICHNIKQGLYLYRSLTTGQKGRKNREAGLSLLDSSKMYSHISQGLHWRSFLLKVQRIPLEIRNTEREPHTNHTTQLIWIVDAIRSKPTIASWVSPPSHISETILSGILVGARYKIPVRGNAYFQWMVAPKLLLSYLLCRQNAV